MSKYEPEVIVNDALFSIRPEAEEKKENLNSPKKKEGKPQLLLLKNLKQEQQIIALQKASDVFEFDLQPRFTLITERWDIIKKIYDQEFTGLGFSDPKTLIDSLKIEFPELDKFIDEKIVEDFYLIYRDIRIDARKWLEESPFGKKLTGATTEPTPLAPTPTKFAELHVLLLNCNFEPQSKRLNNPDAIKKTAIKEYIKTQKKNKIVTPIDKLELLDRLVNMRMIDENMKLTLITDLEIKPESVKAFELQKPISAQVRSNPTLNKLITIQRNPFALIWNDDKSWSSFAKGKHPIWKDLLEIKNFTIQRKNSTKQNVLEEVNKVGNIVYSTQVDEQQNCQIEVFRRSHSRGELVKFYELTKDEFLVLFHLEKISPFPGITLPADIKNTIFNIRKEALPNLITAAKNLSLLFHRVQEGRVNPGEETSFVSAFSEATLKYREAAQAAVGKRLDVSLLENNILSQAPAPKNLDEKKNIKLSEQSNTLLPAPNSNEIKGFITQDEAKLVYIAIYGPLKRGSEIDNLINTGLDDIPHKFMTSLDIINFGYKEIKNDDKAGYHITVLKKNLPKDYKKITERINAYITTGPKYNKKEASQSLIDLINDNNLAPINKLIEFKRCIAIYQKDLKLTSSSFGKSNFLSMLADIEKEINQVNKHTPKTESSLLAMLKQ